MNFSKDQKAEKPIKTLPDELLEILACPECQSELFYDQINQELICKKCNLAFAIEDGIPIMLLDEARQIKTE